VELALPERPAWTEVVGVLAACLVLFVLIVKVDHRMADQAGERARKAQVAQAATEAADADAAARAARPLRRSPRTESIGGRGPISIPLGGAWSAGTTTSVAHDVTTHVTPVATPGLRRIVGPAPLQETTAEPPPASTPERTAAPKATAAPATSTVATTTATPASPTSRSSAATLALLALAALGALMAAAGAVILGRGR
jgi:hypothetical protein